MISYSKDQFRVPFAVGCVIFGFAKNELKILLVPDDSEKDSGRWVLPGEFLHQSYSMDETAFFILKRVTGLRQAYTECLKPFDKPDRFQLERIISIAYFFFSQF